MKDSFLYTLGIAKMLKEDLERMLPECTDSIKNLQSTIEIIEKNLQRIEDEENKKS
jgi:hypothetical protein